MNFDPYIHATTLQGEVRPSRRDGLPPWKSIENLGTNGGGFFNVNGAHPYQNPTPLTRMC